MRSNEVRTGSSLDELYARLDTVRMTRHERQRAMESIAQAEAIADFVVGFAQGINRLMKTLVVHPIRRLTAAIG